jgi:hypothetical protein
MLRTRGPVLFGWSKTIGRWPVRATRLALCWPLLADGRAAETSPRGDRDLSARRPEMAKGSSRMPPRLAPIAPECYKVSRAELSGACRDSERPARQYVRTCEVFDAGLHGRLQNMGSVCNGQ